MHDDIALLVCVGQPTGRVWDLISSVPCVSGATTMPSKLLSVAGEPMMGWSWEARMMPLPRSSFQNVCPLAAASVPSLRIARLPRASHWPEVLTLVR